MEIFRPTEFSANKAWQAINIAYIENATIRLHWTDQPYKWHINDGPEVFVVLDGQVEMHTRKEQDVRKWVLEKGDVFHAEEGDEHVAHPLGEARVLVIEQAGSV